jgi:hypothetical protein
MKNGNRIAFSIALIAALAIVPAAYAGIASGSLYVAGATSNPTHWDIPIGVATTAEIRGVTTAEVGDPLPATINVIVKSSHFGNTTVTGFRIGATSDYSFSYTPPAIFSGGAFDACDTGIVAYQSNGNNSNNDLIDDGLKNGSSNSAAGFRYTNAANTPIPCESVGVEPAPWSSFKQLYR